MLRKRRGVLRTRLGGRLTELEGTVDQPRTADHARQLINKLQSIESDFKKLHFEIIDLIDEDDADSMETEQGVIDKFDDDVSDVLMTPTSPGAVPVTPPDRRRKLSRIQTGFDRIDEAITSEPDTLVELTQFQEELHDCKKVYSMTSSQPWTYQMMMNCSQHTHCSKDLEN